MEITRRPGNPAIAKCYPGRYNRKDKYVDFVGEYHLDLIQDLMLKDAFPWNFYPQK